METAEIDTKLQEMEKKNNANKTKNSLIETEVKKIINFDASYFRGNNYFVEDDTQKYLVIQPSYKYFEVTNFEINSWESRGLSNEKISPVSNPYGANSRIIYNNARVRVKFSVNLLKQNETTYSHGPVVNIYAVYKLASKTNNLNVTLENCQFAVKLTKNADIEKYKYSVYGIGFDSKRFCSHPIVEYGKNIIIFGADMSSSTHANNKTRNILIFGKNVMQGIDGTTIYEEKCIQLILL